MGLETSMQEGAVKTIDRVAAIMTALSDCDAGGLQLGDVAGAAGLPEPTAHRLLGALTNNGFAFQDLTPRRYRLGARAAALGGAARRQHVAATAQLAPDRIAAATGDTAFASVREGAAAVCVARAIGSYPIRTLTLEIGARRPLGVGAGNLALLASLKDAEVARAIAHNAVWLQDYPRFTPPEILGLVKRTRCDGYAINEGRIVAAMKAIGVAIAAADGQPVVALSVAAIWDRMSGERCAELLGILREEARRLQETGDLSGGV
jgi:DNA-binding IclR family transcriptional regulator